MSGRFVSLKRGINKYKAKQSKLRCWECDHGSDYVLWLPWIFWKLFMERHMVGNVSVYCRKYTFLMLMLLSKFVFIFREVFMQSGLVTKSCLTLVTPLTVALQASLSMGFFRQEYWSCHFFSRGSSQPRGQTLVSCIAGGKKVKPYSITGLEGRGCS